MGPIDSKLNISVYINNVIYVNTCRPSRPMPRGWTTTKKLAKLGLGLGYAYHYGLCISLVYFSGGPLLLVDYRLVKRWLGRGLSLINPSHP